MAVGIGFVRNMMKKALVISILLVMAGILAACGQSDESTLTPGKTPDQQQTDEPIVSGSGRVITGEEALDLYGIDVDNPPTPGAASATPQIWFPAKAWVEPSILPYDPNETINFLPMYSKPELEDEGIWLGDLEAGLEVILHGISQDSTVCLVEGPVMQGWDAKGWVACNRLSFTEPD